MLLDIFNNEIKYDDEYEFYCFENCYRIILEYFGVRKPLLLIDAALNLVFTRGGGNKYNYQIRANTNRSSVLPDFRSKVKVHKEELTDPVKVWELNRERVKDGIPIVTGVDVFYLDYQHNYQKTHGAHGVILCGYSKDETTVSVIDWYKPWFYKGRVGIENFLSARSSKNEQDGSIFSGITIGNAWVELDSMGWEYDMCELLNKFICYTIDRYYSNNDIERGGIPESEEIISQGIFALKDALNLTVEYRDAQLDVRKDFLAILHKNLYRVSRRKRFFRLYLKTAMESISLEPLSELTDAVGTIIEKWERLILTALKASMVNNEKLYETLIVNFKEVVSYEENLYESLHKLSAALK